MIFGFIKKLVKYYVDKLVNWMRMQKFNLELDNEIKEFHENWLKENNLDERGQIKKPKIKEVGKFGDDNWSISIGNVNDNKKN